MKLDPSSAAYYALIGICLVLLGALLTGDFDNFSLAERGTVLGGIVAVLGFITWRGARRPPGGVDDG